MPYVDESVKRRVDGATEVLLGVLYNDVPGYEFAPGNVNYVMTKLLLRWWKRNPKYVTICLVVGTLFCVALEFYRRIAVDYEHRKIHENGDCY